MDGKKLLIILSLACGCVSDARAAALELSAMLAYSKADFADGYKSVQRRYTGSIDFKFTAVSALQVEYTDSTTKVSYPTNISMNVTPVIINENTTYRDKIYSFNWVQNLVPSTWLVQPYFVLGGGRMKRILFKEYSAYLQPQTVEQSVVTGTGGLGLRIFLTKSMALKGEVKTYVPKFHFSGWKESQSFSAGLSWLF